MASSAKSKKKARPGLSEATKKQLLVALAVVAVLGGSYWAYYTFTTVPPPSLDSATTDEVTDFFGNARAYARLNVPQREQFLVNTFQRFSDPQQRLELNRSFRQMSHSQKQVFLDATAELVFQRAAEQAQEFNNLPTGKRGAFVDKAVKQFKAMQGDLGGGSAGGGGGTDPNMNIGEPFKEYMPTSSDEWSKIIVTRTNAGERAQMQPFINAITDRYKQLKANPGASVQPFNGG